MKREDKMREQEKRQEADAGRDGGCLTERGETQ